MFVEEETFFKHRDTDTRQHVMYRNDSRDSLQRYAATHACTLVCSDFSFLNANTHTHTPRAHHFTHVSTSKPPLGKHTHTHTVALWWRSSHVGSFLTCTLMQLERTGLLGYAQMDEHRVHMSHKVVEDTSWSGEKSEKVQVFSFQPFFFLS